MENAARAGPSRPGGRLPRLWVIGLDGATFDLIEPWVERGHLPAFAHLLAHGAHGPLYSPVPQSPPAWASFMSGKNPGKHGIYDFRQPIAGRYEIMLVNGAARRAESLWQMLSRSGRRVGVVNVPMTFPPEPVNGFLIAGFDTPFGNTAYAHPPGLHSELLARFGGYTFFPEIVGVPLRQVVENFHRTIDLRERVIDFLLAADDLDFLIMVFNSTDSVQHLCLQSLEESPKCAAQLGGLRSIYEHLDRLLGRLMRRLPADTALLVVSDHGAGPLRCYVNLDHWLAARGWLRYADDDPALAPRRQRAEWLAAVARRTKRFLPGRLVKRLRQNRWFESQLRSMTAVGTDVAAVSRLDWGRTRACTWGTQGIYLNVRGREPEGTVEPGAGYEAACAALTVMLHQLVDPETGEPIVERVWKKQDLFPGPYNDVAPDLYIHWRGDAYKSWVDPEQPRDELFRRARPLGWDDIVPRETSAVSVGCHRRQGIFILFGDAFARPGRLAEPAGIVDVVPTVLALMGEAVPADLDGHVLASALNPAHLGRFPIRFRSPEGEMIPEARAYSDAEAESLERRLKELGYL
jgi:predicted AlkP superfamily phosphohydrolase/phosphomutase